MANENRVNIYFCDEDINILTYLKVRARMENRSVNSFIMSVLTDLFYEEIQDDAEIWEVEETAEGGLLLTPKKL